jgi:hypothetical protein
MSGTYRTLFDKVWDRLRLYLLVRYLLFWKNGKRRGDAPSDPPSA